jgi:EAL domain-containing protein (putative c-di-GMP-specific phosphodiesterase class I)
MRMLVDLGELFGIRVVAEGIEREDQLRAVRELGCEMGQGYLLGRPMELATARVPAFTAWTNSMSTSSTSNTTPTIPRASARA